MEMCSLRSARQRNSIRAKSQAGCLRVSICDDSFVSGHLIALKACADIGFVTAILRYQGQPVTWMNSDIAADRAYLKVFGYDSDDDLQSTVESAVRWARQKVIDRAEFYNREYPWRNPNLQLG